MTTTQNGAPSVATPAATAAHATGPSWPRRLMPLSAPAFVVLVLTGNGLTETVAVTGGAPAADALATFAAKAGNPTVIAGTVMELAGFVLLALFAAWLVEVLRRRAALGTAGFVALIGAVLMLAVKLASAAPYLTGILHHETITPGTALLLSALNGTGFVIGWLPWALFVAGAAVALRGAGLLGRIGHATGLLVGVLALIAAVAGVVVPDNANPLPFLAGLVWVLVVGVRLALGQRS